MKLKNCPSYLGPLKYFFNERVELFWAVITYNMLSNISFLIMRRKAHKHFLNVSLRRHYQIS